MDIEAYLILATHKNLPIMVCTTDFGWREMTGDLSGIELSLTKKNAIEFGVTAYDKHNLDKSGFTLQVHQLTTSKVDELDSVKLLEKRIEKIRARALKKLTPEEISALGI